MLNPWQKVWNGNRNPCLADEEIEDVETVEDSGRSDIAPLSKVKQSNVLVVSCSFMIITL